MCGRFSSLKWQARDFVVALSVECRTCDQDVVGSSLGHALGVKTQGMFLTPMCLCHQTVQVGTGIRAVMSCGWGVKAGMVRMWVAGKTVIPLLHTGHI